MLARFVFMEIPAIDQNICNSWTQQELDLYNKLPFYLVKAETQYRQRWSRWAPLLGSVNWQPNMGDTMRSVVVEPSPVLRQTASPNPLNQTPMADVIAVRERTTDTNLFQQDFVSPHFNFLPSFQDFLKGNIMPAMENITRQIEIFRDMFYRWHIWNWSPYVYVAGVGLVAAPVGTNAKTADWMAASVFSPAQQVQEGYLSFKEIYAALNALEEELGATPYSGSGTPGGDSSPLQEKFCLIQSPQSWNNLIDDPWLKENRPLNMNIVNAEYRGDYFGRVMAKLERYPMRFKTNNALQYTLPDPETIELNPDAEDYGRTKPNPDYARIGTGSQWEVSWLIGGNAYDKVNVGGPPPNFAAAQDGRAMDWSGKVYMTKQFMVPCADANGVVGYDFNSFGRYLRLQGSLSVGIRGMNPHCVLPIISKRRSRITTVLPVNSAT